ncbi:MAG: S41 family peptidase [Prolixibacteraceae bacterium]
MQRFKMRGIGFIMTVVLFLFVASLHAQNVETNMIKYGRLMQLIENYYVDTANIDKLTENAVVEVLGKLDPHSVYISKDEVREMNEPLEGNFEGIGISFNILRDTLLVVTTIPGGPSEKAGLMPGDRIMVIDEKPVAGTGLKNSDVMSMLRGQKGTRVHLKIKRGNEKELIDFTLVRDKIPLYSLDAAYMLNDHSGYIKLNRFSATTTEEFTEAIGKLKKNQGFKNLVLDLRGNGGGYLKAAIEMADQFLGARRLVVYTEGVHEPRKDYNASALGEFEEGRLVVLIDEGSASASEIVAGAMQDWDRGIIIGRRSFGKGLVQQPFPLTDGSLIRLTTAHYYTPSGRGIQKPYDKGVDEYRKDYLNRFESGELFTRDSIQVDKNQLFNTLKNKRVVYGGGGVMPDIFVPMDTSIHYKFYNLLVRQNILYSATLDYLISNRRELSVKYKEFRDFDDHFEVGGQFIDDMLKEAEKGKIEKDEAGVNFARPLIRKQVKALLARDLYGPDYYYRVMNKDEAIIEKALEVLNEPAEYEHLLAEKLNNAGSDL